MALFRLKLYLLRNLLISKSQQLKDPLKKPAQTSPVHELRLDHMVVPLHVGFTAYERHV